MKIFSLSEKFCDAIYVGSVQRLYTLCSTNIIYKEKLVFY